jgi:hypothetical protein
MHRVGKGGQGDFLIDALLWLRLCPPCGAGALGARIDERIAIPEQASLEEIGHIGGP